MDMKRHPGVTTAPDVLTEGPDRLMVGAITHISVPFYNGNLEVKVKVIDERKRFGKRDYQIVPIAGVGMVWVGEARLRDPEPSYKVTKGDQDRTNAKNAARRRAIEAGEIKESGGWQKQRAEEAEAATQMAPEPPDPRMASRGVRNRR